MATLTIGTGGDYATLTLWEAARQGQDATETAQFLDDDDIDLGGREEVTLDGWDAQDVIIEGQNSHLGDPTCSAQGARIQGGGVRITVGDADLLSVTVRDLVFNPPTSSFFCVLVRSSVAGVDVFYENVIWDTIDTGFGNSGTDFEFVGTTNATFTNCLWIDCPAAIRHNSYDGGGPALIVYYDFQGCTFVNSSLEINTAHASSLADITARGCLFTGAAASINHAFVGSGTLTARSYFCLTAETSAAHTALWGTTSGNSYEVDFVTGTPASGEVGFTNMASDDYSLVDHANNLAINYVTSGTMPATDIIGTTRDANPDAGAFEVASAGPSYVELGSDITGSGTLTASESIVRAIQASLSASGTLSASETVDRALNASLSASGALSLSESVERALAATIAATGTLAANLGYAGSTTTLASYIGGYDVDVMHGHFNLRGSTALQGEVYQGIGEWRVYETGNTTPIKEINGPLDFAHLGQDEHVVYGRYTDRNGNKGSWQSYTFSVTGTHAASFYVNGSTGNDTTGDGSSGNPWATVSKGVTELLAVVAADEVGALYIAEAQDYDQGNSRPYGGDNSTRRRIDFLRWGTSSTRPRLTNCAGMATGWKGSFRIDGVDMVTTADTNNAFTLERLTGAVGDFEPYNVIVERCETTGPWVRGVMADGSVGDHTNRDKFSFAFFDTWKADGYRGAYAYGYSYPQHFAFVNCEWGDYYDGSFFPYRLGRLAHSYFEGGGFNQSASSQTNQFRFLVGNGTGDARSHSVSFVNWQCLLNGGNFRFEGSGGAMTCEDISFVNCTVHSSDGPVRSWNWSTSGVSTWTGTSFQRIHWLNCKAERPWGIDVSASTPAGTFNDLTWTNCAGIGEDNGYQMLALAGSNTAAFADGAINGRSCAALVDGGGGTAAMFDAPTAAKVGSIDNCHYGVTGGSGTYTIAPAGYAGSGNSVTLSTDFNWTAPVATWKAFDPTLVSASGPLAGTGYPVDYSIDAAGFVRDASTPDAGPYEFGASTSPDMPVAPPSYVELGVGLTGTGSMSLEASLTLAMGAVLTGSGSLSAALTQTLALSASLSGSGSLTADLSPVSVSELEAALSASGSLTAGLTIAQQLAAALSASGSLAGTLSLGQQLAASLSGSSQMTALLVSDLALACTISGQSSMSLSLGVLSPPAPPAPPPSVEATLMKKRIHNTLHDTIKQGTFYRCSIDPRTGVMSISDTPITPTAITIKETKASFRQAERYRRGFAAGELESWTWIARVLFSSEVASEIFETDVLAAGIKIPPIEGLATQRTLLARLVDSDYTHPPEQSPSRGSTVDFIFEVIPQTLRK